MKTRWLFIVAVVLVLLVLLGFSTGCGTSELTKRMNYQGRLTDAAGNAIDGTRNMTFRLYNAVSGGTKVWEETQSGVQVSAGLFNVALGSVTPLNEADFHQALWLEVVVDSEVLPRQALYGAPYAYSLVPGAVVKGYINNTETYSSTLTVANFGSGQGLSVVSLSGPAIYAQGPGSALLADGAIQSSAKSYVWISGNSLMRSYDSDSTKWTFLATGAATIYRGANAGGKTIFYPLTIPSVLYGTPVKLTKLTVQYICQDGDLAYISETNLYRQKPDMGALLVGGETTDHKSETATTYTLNLTTNNVLSASEGPLCLYLVLSFADDTHYVRIGGIRLELEHRQ